MPARLLLALLLILCSAGPALGRPARYAAMLASGKRIEGDRLSNWYDASGIPHLSGQPLLHPSDPFRWLRDRSQPLAEPRAAYVEFTNGDVLPGVAVDFRTGLEDPFAPQPPHLVVRVAVNFEPPENRPVKEIRVLAQFVRRVIWQRRERQPAAAGTAVYRDGRTLALRALRWQAGQVHVLSPDEDRRIDWSELAELHLPPVDPWTAYVDQLAAVCPTSATRLIEIETSTGLVATASLARLALRFEGNSSDPDRWVHGLQPAWSLDILWIPFREIAWYRSYAPAEVPLSRIAPQQVVHHGGLAGGRPVQINRSVTGMPLQSQTREFGWGLGVAGATDLVFALPPAARSLRTLVCLDRSSGSGGCIRPRIFAGDGQGKPLWEGPLLVGSQAVADSGPLPLDPAAGPLTLVLQIDPVPIDRPAGADPFDIRDQANWCDPLVTLDPAAVQAQLDQRLPRHFAAWDDWTLQTSSGQPPHERLEISFHRSEQIPGAFESAVRAVTAPLVLRREAKIGPRDNWLIIAASRPKERRDEPRIEVWLDGRRTAEFTVPAWRENPQDNRPLAVPLTAFQGSERAIPIEIRQSAEPAGASVQYRAIAITQQLPTLQRVLEEQAELAPLAPDQTGSATITADDHYWGARALRLLPAGQFRLELPQTVRVRAQPKWGEARFMRLAVRKHGGGRFAIELEDGQPRDELARYDLGQGEPSYGGATRIWQERLPAEWIVVTRDLFADFGNIDVRAIIVGCPDGEAALVDHLYLGRHPSDFELIPTDEPP